ncbi:MAG: nickel pincer cofactor biosynthesis protein LarC [Gemmatimonadota bacterium]|nr:MAG: nickel pincer cofactor biosynthesis protein LarC [Gemmatimonadota bacterium]
MMSGPHRCLIFDPFSGISGDMILAGLLDLGLAEEWLQELVGDLPLKVKVETSSVLRGPIRARRVVVGPRDVEPDRRLADVLQVLDAAQVVDSARKQAATAFRRLAEAEAEIHGVSVDEVQFHEVGAADAIVDILGVCAGVAELGVEIAYTRAAAIGRGWITSQHGQLPLPAPATMKLLEGIPVFDSGLDGELVTPTGAVLLSVLTEGKPVPGTFRPLRSGFGAGGRNPPDHPNCLRIVLAELASAGSLMMVLQADLDDMSPEYVPPLIDALFKAGATDVTTLPVQMKKGRTGVRIETLVTESHHQAVAETLLRESTTLGLRYWHVDRQVLPREIKTIEWRGNPIRVKISTTPGGHLRYKLEYSDVIQAARRTGTSALATQREIERSLRLEEKR